VEGDPDVERRGFIGLVAKAAMVGLTGAELERIRVVPQAAPASGRIGEGDVRNLENTIEFFRTQDDQFGGESIKSAVLGHLQWSARMLDSSTSDDVRNRLRCALADLYSLAGWVSFDTGAHKQANRHFANALVLAKESKEHTLAAKVLFQMGRVYLHQKESESALKVFQLGQLSAQDANSPRAVALLCLNTAWAHAEMGNAKQTESLLSRASDELARDDDRATPAWLNFMSPAEIEGISGMAYTALSAHDASFAELGAHHASRSFEMRDDTDARSRASDLIAMAANNLRAGNVTEGVRIASQVLPRLESVRSARLMDRLAWVQQGANLHPHQGEARELAERIATLRAA
jgi:tetratricopeptide (TPR) repeat protein